MNVGDAVRVKHPTGGILAEHSFRVEEVPEDPDGWVVIRGDIGGRHGVRNFKFHRLSLEVIGAAPSVDPTAVHPATQRRINAEVEYRHRLSRYVSARVLHNKKEADQDYVDRCRDELTQGFENVKDACYAELDDEHGLGKEGLDTAREVVADAVWYPLNRMSAGDRKDDAWLVSDDKMRALAEAIGCKDELS